MKVFGKKTTRQVLDLRDIDPVEGDSLAGVWLPTDDGVDDHEFARAIAAGRQRDAAPSKSA